MPNFQMDFILQPPTPISKRKFQSFSDNSIIGPRLDVSNHLPLRAQIIDLQFEEQPKSTTNYSSQHVQVSSDFHYLSQSSRQIMSSIPQIRVEKNLKKMGQHPSLKQLIMQQKIRMIVRNFTKKLSRNKVNSSAVDYTPFFSQKQLSFLDQQGIQLNNYCQIASFLCSIILIVVFSILSTFCFVFKQIENSATFIIFSKVSLIYFVFEIFLNLITVKFQEGKRLSTIRQILHYYVRQTLITDVTVIVILFIDQLLDSQNTQMKYFRVLIILKISQLLEKIQRLEALLIHNFYYEQYWTLIKVFLFNFSFAHILAICLIYMAVDDDLGQSWMGYKDIYLAPWYQKYSWAYYWAATIMLTVGFGDLNATNYQEAAIITLLAMISCMALAYNINCVGLLISNIRAQDLEKGKNFKIFYKLSRKNDLSQDLEWRINNYIEESSNIKKKFNFEQENQFVDKLPQGLKAQFLKESNKKIFKALPFFMHVTQRAIFKFAQKISMQICHPEQIIQHLEDPHNLLILKGGEIGYTCKKPGCKYNSTVVDKLKIKNISNPILISLGFINNPRLNYEIKSLAYSVLYFLDYDSILSILKTCQIDYQYYCLLKDRALYIPDEFQLFNCQICKGKHTKFSCPKLHFIPIKQHVINRYMKKFKQDINSRTYSRRYCEHRPKSLQIFSKNFQISSQRTDKSFFAKMLFRKTSRRKGLHISRAYDEDDTSIKSTSFKSLSRQISDIRDYVTKSAAEVIKEEIIKVLNFDQYSDQVWTIRTDRIQNYVYYFEKYNSYNLMDNWMNSVFLRERIQNLGRRDSIKLPNLFNWTMIQDEKDSSGKE